MHLFRRCFPEPPSGGCWPQAPRVYRGCWPTPNRQAVRPERAPSNPRSAVRDMLLECAKGIARGAQTDR